CTGNGFPLYKSPDLVHWTAAGHIFHISNKPVWGAKNWWAPEIHHIDGTFVVYFAALSPSRGRMCIGAARASSVEGPCQDLGHPLLCAAQVGLIDPNVHNESAGRHFLYYKTAGNSLHPPQKTIIYGQQLRANGIGFIGSRHRMIQNTLPWEGAVVEAP